MCTCVYVIFNIAKDWMRACDSPLRKRAMFHKPRQKLRHGFLQSPEQFGRGSAFIFNNFVKPMHDVNTALVASLADLTEACQPILLHGWSPERVAKVQDAFAAVEGRRYD